MMCKYVEVIYFKPLPILLSWITPMLGGRERNVRVLSPDLRLHRYRSNSNGEHATTNKG